MLNISTIEDISLRLCLADSPAVAESLLDDWDQTINIDTMGFAIMRLCPLIYSQTQRFALTSSHQARLRVIYQYWWIAYQHRSNQLKKVADLLSQRGITVMTLKGMALADYYPQQAVRAMADIDLLVAPQNRAGALQALLEAGWELEFAHKAKKSAAYGFFKFYPDHGVALIQAKSSVKLDLHHRLGSHTSDALTELVWSNPARSTSTALQKPNRPIELFMVILHAVISDFQDNLNWLVDLAHMSTVLTTQDWQKAHGIAISEKKETLFLRGIKLAAHYGIAVPSALMSTSITNTSDYAVIPRFSEAKPLSRKWLRETITARYGVIRHRFPEHSAYRRIAGLTMTTLVMAIVFVAPETFARLGRSLAREQVSRSAPVPTRSQTTDTP